MQYFKDQYLVQFYLLKIVISRNILQKYFLYHAMERLQLHGILS